jgi:hypothetical protein
MRSTETAAPNEEGAMMEVTGGGTNLMVLTIIKCCTLPENMCNRAESMVVVMMNGELVKETKMVRESNGCPAGLERGFWHTKGEQGPLEGFWVSFERTTAQ